MRREETGNGADAPGESDAGSGNKSGHWSDFARMWPLFGPPLRPCEEDLAIFRQAVTDWSAARAPDAAAPRAVILGVTPELHDLPWPAGSDVIAVDHNPAMIDQVWPGDAEAVFCAEWTQLPLDDASRDIAITDGGLMLIPWPDAHRTLVRELSRVIAPGGVFIARLYARLDPVENPGDVLRDLLAGTIPSTNALKLRLWTSIPHEQEEGLVVNTIWETIHSAIRDLDELADLTGWRRAEVRLLETYRGGAVRYYFPTIRDLDRLFCDDPGGFERVSVTMPTYALGDRCPVVTYRRA